MNRDEARKILRAYRATEPDRSDPEFAQALGLAREDPELTRWLEEETSLDSAIAAKLAALPPPADLRGKILTRSAGTDRAAGTLAPWMRRVAVIAVIVGLPALVWYGAWRKYEPKRFAPWQADALAFLDRMVAGREKLDVESAKSQELIAWLRQASAPVPGEIPPSLQHVESVGCKTLLAGQKRVSIICFHVDADHIAHLVTVEKRQLAGPPPEKRPQFVQKRDWMTASWSEQSQSFMLAMKGSEPEMRKLLSMKAMPQDRSYAAGLIPFAPRRIFTRWKYSPANGSPPMAGSTYRAVQRIPSAAAFGASKYGA